MIANRGRGRMTGTSSFDAAVAYIVREGPEHERDHEPPLAVWSENVASLETAALEMRATASQSRAQEPLYHLIVSWDIDERPSYAAARAALDTQITQLGFAGLQYVAALQNDGVGGLHHVHAVFNRVDPVTHVAREVWQDRDKMRAACREAEREGGWRELTGTPRHELSHGARDVEYHHKQRSFERYVREDVGPAVRAAVARETATWADVHRAFDEHGVRYEEVRRQGRDGRGGDVQGGRVVGVEPGQYARARDLGPDLTHRKLEERLGPFERSAKEHARPTPFRDRLASAAVDVEQLRGREKSWADVHAVFDRHGVEYQKYRTGARLMDLDSPQHAKPSEVDRGLALGAMTKEFGAYESSQHIRDREAAGAAIKHAQSLVVGAQLLADPSSLLERLTANNATFTLSAAERLINERVVDREQRQEILEKVVAESVELRDEQGKTRLTTSDVLKSEAALYEAVEGLAGSRREVAIARPASERLDEQQRRAYDYAVADDSRLKVVTGVPGAGKTTLITEIAAAYESAGYNVRAVSIANSAVDVLRQETTVPAQSVAKELYEWSQGRGKLGARDLLIIDEVSTLGTKQGAELLGAAHQRSATVIALGDDKQFQAVAHGSALELMQRAVRDGVDLEKTRRQREGWQREATQAVRRGDVAAAIGAYRERGHVREFGTQDEARSAVVARWREIESGGVECGIEAFTNRERIAINALAREEWRAMGRLSGGDVRLDTTDGQTPYAVGERVVIRETIREAGLFNGSVGTVQGIDGATLQIERRDGKVVGVDTREHPGVQHGYCSTEYREQGATRYAELQLVTEHVNQRSLTVGMTRHTDEYAMFYSREAVGSYDDLVGLGLRTRSKELASDYGIVERTREPKLQEMTLGELREELKPIAQGRVAGYDVMECRAAFGILNATERSDARERVRTSRNWHDMLKLESPLRAQVKEIGERERGEGLFAHRAPAKDRERGHGMER